MVTLEMLVITRHLGGCPTPHKGLFLGSSKQRTQGGGVKSGLLYVLIPMARALHCHAGALSPSVWGDGWSNLCTLITQWATGVQPHPAPESNQTPPGEAASTRAERFGEIIELRF